MKKKCALFFISLLLLCDVARAQAASLPLYTRIVAVDPGHGGPDPGATRGDLREKDITLELALDLRDLLQAGGAAVYLTRDSDTDLAEQNLQQVGGRKRRDILRRVQLVNDWCPDVFISLHVNAIAAERWRGAQVFFQSHNPDSEALAGSIQDALIKVLQNTTRRPKTGDFRVLTDTQCTAVLVEVGFISNPQEAALLADPDYRQQIAWAIYLGLQDWFNR